MRLLFDTTILLHLAQGSTALSGGVRLEVLDEGNTPCFSPANIWQIYDLALAGVPGFSVDPGLLYRGLLDNGYTEIPVTSVHISRSIELRPVRGLQALDRMLVAQAEIEGIRLLTVSTTVANLSNRAELVELLPWRKRATVADQNDDANAAFAPEDYNGWTMI